ncbi:hypothetical protein NST63_18140 [Heyndrickxia sp. FSL W8-0496]|uniref:hypothetical protein n=1 Tax=Heyndrickxia sp. FSL W8-0496 TaxID=2954702 RepID=UPI0030F58692
MYASDGLPQEYYRTLNDSVILADLHQEVIRYLEDYQNATVEEVCEAFQIASMFEDEVQAIYDEWREKDGRITL